MLPALITAATSLIGGQRANEASVGMDREARAWMEEQSNTAHQREISDLRRAGLNPILSAGGSGASVGSASGTPISDVITPALNTGMAVKDQKSRLDLQEQQTHNIQEDTAKKTFEKHIAQTDMALGRKTLEDNVKKIKLENDGIQLQNKTVKEMLPHLVKKAKATGDWSQVNEALGAMKAVTSSASDVSDVIKPVKIQLKGK